LNLRDDIYESAKDLVYILDNPDKEVLKDVKGTIADLTFLSKKITQKNFKEFN
tara:strand:+ start:1175 stop:1333 length:159 start_codon:yes stop_codon:yes gene_type:complete